MAYPDFTPEEEYYISYVKQADASLVTNPTMWGYLLCSSVFFSIGAYQSSMPVMVIAFAVMVGYRIYEEFSGAKWTAVWRSIIEKFEAAAATDSEVGNEP